MFSGNKYEKDRVGRVVMFGGGCWKRYGRMWRKRRENEGARVGVKDAAIV